ncbi:hydrogenase [Hyphomonas sp.]|jgi:hydroxylaminobenzene mutase|uniref:hydrogenase n=1 Tax=Hyphomonas sp. TaxID=87 RepID=UPI0039E42B2C
MPDIHETGARAARQKDRLLQLGALLFLLGLLSGLVTGLMANPRMGLSAHMQGLTNGTFLLAAGAVWDRANLGPRTQALAFWAVAFGTSVNWLMTQLAAIWGTGKMTPIVGAGHEGADWQEMVVSLGLLALTLAMLVGAALLLAGPLRRAN